MTKRLFLCLALIATVGSVTVAQEFSYGFKAGLNYSTFRGPLEEDAAGNTVEEYDYTNGFHVGALFNLAFTDLMGLRAELLYSQKGARYRYDGASFQVFTTDSGSRIISEGDKFITLKITNSYIDLPVMGYAKLTDWLEVSLGANVGLLINTTGIGELVYSGTTRNGSNVEEFAFTLEYNYFADQTGEADFTDAADPFVIEGEFVTLPTIVGAYYDQPRGDRGLFNVLDIGLNAGLSFFLNSNLYVGGRVNYGLTDLTNTEYDFSRVSLGPDDQLVTRDDADQNLSIQASVGFSF